MTANVYAATATPFISQSVGVFSAMRHKYRESTGSSQLDIPRPKQKVPAWALTNRVTGAKRQQDRLHRKGNGEEMLGTRISLLEVDHLRAAAVWKVARELEVRAEPGYGHDKADDPVDERQADRACVGKDRSGWNACLAIATIKQDGPDSIKPAEWVVSEQYVRVEKIPVPTIWFTFRKITVSHPTLYPSGDFDSTGAPTASWYDGCDSFPPLARTYARPPSLRIDTSDSEVLAPGLSAGRGLAPRRDRSFEKTIVASG